MGYQKVRIKEIDHSQDEVLGTSLGCYIGSIAEIRVRNPQVKEEKVNTIIHEILHAVFKTYSMKEIIHDEKHEELIVGTFANGLSQVFQDNPDLLDWIKQ